MLYYDILCYYVNLCFRIRRYRIRATNIPHHNVHIHVTHGGTMTYTYTNITMENIQHLSRVEGTNGPEDVWNNIGN